MENNNWSWYENATSNQTNGYYGQQNDNEKKKKKAVTWGQLIACMLVMTLLGAGIGAGAGMTTGAGRLTVWRAAPASQRTTVIPAPVRTVAESIAWRMATGSHVLTSCS